MNQPHQGKFRQLSAGPMERAWEAFLVLDRRFRFSDLAVCLLLAFLVVLMVQHEVAPPSLPVFKEGQVASRTVRVRKSVDVEDKDATEAEKAQVISRIPDVYDFDSAVVPVWADRWKMAVKAARYNRLREKSVSARAQFFAAKAGIEVDTSEYQLLEKIGFSPDLEKSVTYALAPLWDQKILDKKIPLTFAIELVDLKSNKSEVMRARDISSILSIEDAQVLVGKAGKANAPKLKNAQKLPWSKWSMNQRGAVFVLQARLVQANVTLNRKETEKRREAALKEFRPLVQKLAKGEVIVREGERVSRKAARLIVELNKMNDDQKSSATLPYEVLFAAFSLWIVVIYLRRQYPYLFNSNKDCLVAGAGLVTSLAVFKLSLIFQIDFLAEQFGNIPASFFLFLLPVAAPAMMMRLLLSPGLTVVFSLLYAIGAAILMEKAALFGVYILLSCLMGSLFLAHCRTRGELYKAGLRTAVTCGISAAILVAAWGGKLPVSVSFLKEVADGFENSFQNCGWALLGGAAGGWIASALTLVLTPILENLLDYTTDLKLLELARMDHPLLRDLVLKAPGTYHHSIIVGSLVEAGAEAIGANALLARVGSYYHDIGKIERAEYFIENQTKGTNPHDSTKAQLSAKIIISHVKEGKALAQTHKLGQNLIDFIEQHHGTSLVSYFYNKAQQDAAQPGSSIAPDEVREEDFRYPGPKPQTKENAILALADSCEAATRSLVDPTPARIDGMVKKIIGKAFTEGTLDEADITLREVHLVGQAFTRILMGIHHNRIQYPDQEKGLPRSDLTLLKKAK